MANLLSSHIIVFTIVNHNLTLLNVGYFYRKEVSIYKKPLPIMCNYITR